MARERVCAATAPGPQTFRHAFRHALQFARFVTRYSLQTSDASTESGTRFTLLHTESYVLIKTQRVVKHRESRTHTHV